jgi:hypothetical protein
MMPERLFHYQKFVDDHLVSLLSERKVKLSRPDSFNDPWDCRVHYQAPSDADGRGRLFDWLIENHRKHFPGIDEAHRARSAQNLMANPSILAASLVQMEDRLYKAICEAYRVYCLSEKPDSPLMCAHYSASHTGICLEFDAQKPPFARQSAATKVEYRATYPANDIVTVGYEPLVTKSADWEYEAEWRLIAEERAFARSPLTIKTDDAFLILPEDVLKSVTIGCLADESSRLRIAHTVKTHAPNVLIRQATLASDRYELRISPPFRDV